MWETQSLPLGGERQWGIEKTSMGFEVGPTGVIPALCSLVEILGVFHWPLSFGFLTCIVERQ